VIFLLSSGDRTIQAAGDALEPHAEPSTDAEMQMTRENKLALVVGFALILFVGILISDHFSTARNQESANLSDNRPLDPLVSIRRSDPDLLELRPPPTNSPRNTGTPAVNQASIPTQPEAGPVAQRPEAGVVEMGGVRFTKVEEETVAPPPYLFHEVKAGESLTSICRRYYGDESLVKALARFNEIADPNSVRANHRLRIPAAETLGGSALVKTPPLPNSPAPPRAPERTVTSYTVQSGDSLSEIAQRHMGSARKWRELYEFNKDVIRDPDNVQAGTVLKIPAS
jgi:nucleoid-associated protein YgaU